MPVLPTRNPGDPHHLVLVDLALAGHADIADHMGHGAGLRVTAGRRSVGLHAGQLRGEQVEQGEFAPREAFADQDGENSGFAAAPP
jgi:hypothetical protein